MPQDWASINYVYHYDVLPGAFDSSLQISKLIWYETIF